MPGSSSRASKWAAGPWMPGGEGANSGPLKMADQKDQKDQEDQEDQEVK
jgi:hypothetical protein